MSNSNNQKIDSSDEERTNDLVNIRVNILGCEGSNSIGKSNGRSVLINLGGHNGVATISKKDCSKEVSAIYEIINLVSIPEKYKIHEKDYILYDGKKRIPFNLELASDVEIAKFINSEQLIKLIYKNGIICNDENTMNIYNEEKMKTVVGRQYDYEKLCIKILLLYSGMQLLSSCSNNHLFGNVKKNQIINALGLFIYSYCKNFNLASGGMCQLLNSYYVDKTLEDMIELSITESYFAHTRELKNITVTFDEANANINLVANDWFSYCSYELILLWKFVKGSSVIKNCKNPNCGAPFNPSKHGNEEYCPACIKKRRRIIYNPEERHELYEAKKMGISVNEYRAQKLAEGSNQKKEGVINGTDN